MGQLLSQLRGDAHEEKAKQDLEILQKLVDAKLDQYQSEINERFLNPDNTAKTMIPGIRALRWERRAYTEIQDKPAAAIDGAVDDFFKIGDKDTDTKTVVKSGFKNVVKTALDAFLGNTDIGEKNEEKFFVYMVHNTVVRIDIKLYRWNFAGKGITDVHKSILGYIMCLSVVDPTRLKTAEFVYLISEYSGDDEENVNHYIATMGKMYSSARKLKIDQREPVIPQVEF